MIKDQMFLNARTFAGVFSSVSILMDVVFGRYMHCVRVKVRRCRDVFIGSSLLNVYCKCGEMWDARKAMRLFKEVVRDRRDEGCVNEFVVMSVLSEFVGVGRSIHCLVFKYKLLGMRFCWECDCDDARKGFYHLQEPDIVLWTLIIGWYVQNGENESAMDLFCRMQTEGIPLNEFPMVSVLNMFKFGCIKARNTVHATTIKHGLGLEVPIASALSTMYAKCRSLKDGGLVFTRMPSRDVVSWNLMISELGAYAREKLMVEKVVVGRRYGGVMVVDDGGYDEFDDDLGCEYVVGIDIELKG
ncbi:pentatricopeptide repeat-containing protein [Tanacetum coccineum]